MNLNSPVEYSRTSRFVELKGYNTDGKGNDFVEATQWNNGAGFDLHLSRGEQCFSLTLEEYYAMLAALGDWVKQPADPCPHMDSTPNGTNYCRLGLNTLLGYAEESLK